MGGYLTAMEFFRNRPNKKFVLNATQYARLSKAAGDISFNENGFGVTLWPKRIDKILAR